MEDKPEMSAERRAYISEMLFKGTDKSRMLTAAEVSMLRIEHPELNIEENAVIVQQPNIVVITPSGYSK